MRKKWLYGLVALSLFKITLRQVVMKGSRQNKFSLENCRDPVWQCLPRTRGTTIRSFVCSSHSISISTPRLVHLDGSLADISLIKPTLTVTTKEEEAGEKVQLEEEDKKEVNRRYEEEEEEEMRRYEEPLEHCSKAESYPCPPKAQPESPVDEMSGTDRLTQTCTCHTCTGITNKPFVNITKCWISLQAPSFVQ